MKEEAVGVQGDCSQHGDHGETALFLSEKGNFLSLSGENQNIFYTVIPKPVTLEVHHQYFVSTGDHTTISLHIVTDISPFKAQIHIFTICTADSSYFPPSHWGALHICFLMKTGQVKEAPAWH